MDSKYVRYIPQVDLTRNREVFIHIPFTYQFLQNIPNDFLRTRVISESLLYIMDYVKDTFGAEFDILPIVPFSRKFSTEFIGFKISGPSQVVQILEDYFANDDNRKGIQAIKRYFKQMYLKKKPISSLQPYPQLFFPTQISKYNMWTSPTLSPTPTKFSKQWD